MRAIRSVSILMPTYQGIEFLPRVLDALAEQSLDLPWDFRAIDSGSTDGTWELLGRYASGFPVPLFREPIDPVEFDHGDTRNLLAARSKGDLLVFLTQDAIPRGTDWLATLVANFDDSGTGAAYCRNVARSDAELLTRIFSENDLGYEAGRREVRIENRAEYEALDTHGKRLLYNFNDVASAIRRELWERHPFPRTTFGEDILMARALLEAGFTVVYDEAAIVEHSHDYTAAETHRRGVIDGRFNVEWLGRTCVASEADARILARRQREVDRRELEEAGLSGRELKRELRHARGLREALFGGLHEGGCSERRFPATRLRERTDLDLLYVVHGFPPDTWAGTEIYTYNIASEMQRRGHRCTVLHRVPASRSVEDGGPPDFSIEEGEFQGLRVLRWTHRLEHKSLRDSYQHRGAEQAFRRLLLRESPDVVHFQHLLHTSAGLVAVAREFGLPTVVHCHDYWALCPRVQLIRPDGVRCEENRGSGCFPCVNEQDFGLIDPLARLDSVVGPMLSALERGALAAGGPGGGMVERLRGFDDLHRRHEYVTAAYAAADLRISPSRFLRSKYVESAGCDPHTFLFSDNGMRTDHIHALEKSPDPAGRIRFGFVGSLVWYKGGEVLVRAMREMVGLPALLNVFGGFDPATDEHHAELRRLAEGAAVEFKGRFDNSRLSEVYAEIDVLVVPSLWFENSPITIHEAFLTGTPVLASNIGGMAEFVRDGIDGLHFETGDAADLASKMRRFVEEPRLVEDLSQDFMEIKRIEQNAEELEFRYRALVCRERTLEVSERSILCVSATDTSARSGAAEAQGEELLLLRPEEGTAVEFDISGCGGGEREILIRGLTIGGERDVLLGGLLSIDGNPVGELPDRRGEGTDDPTEDTFRVSLADDAARLRLEPGPDRFLRLRELEVRVPLGEEVER
jgi:glycosyltransferase involved in cell wall biosynthesis